MRSSAMAMMADVPGGRLSPISLRSSSLKPLSRTLPQIPPAPPPTAAETMMLGGKINPTTPPAMAPRLAHFLPLGSAVSSNLTLPRRCARSRQHRSDRSRRARCADWNSFSAAPASCSSRTTRRTAQRCCCCSWFDSPRISGVRHLRAPRNRDHTPPTVSWSQLAVPTVPVASRSYRPISSVNAGSWRIGSKSESSLAYSRNRSDISIARRRWSTASAVRPAALSQQARL